MKKLILVFLICGVCIMNTFGVAVSAAEVSYKANDWMPYNYVLTEGFGLNMKKVDVRTSLGYSDNELSVSGSTTKGGMGVTFMPEVDLSNFSMEMSLDTWQVNSTDKFFGISFMDKAEKKDMFNELPFFSKHSESWSNDYGAGQLFAFRPFAQDGTNARPGILQLQFNNIGITHSFTESTAGGTYNADSGQYSDGLLGWTGYLSTIQLYNEDWTPKTNYDNIKITCVEAKNADGEDHDGYYFDMNGGYWARTDDSIVWPYQEEEGKITITDQGLFDELDIDKDGSLSETEKNLFKFGPAYSAEINGVSYDSVIPGINWGDPLFNVYNFNKTLKKDGKRLYLNVMYKDAFNMPEGQKAQFTIKSINGQNSTASETTSLVADKTVTENGITAVLKETNLHAGVYPSRVNGIITASAEAKNYSKALESIESKKTELGVQSYDVINFMGEVTVGSGLVNVELLDKLSVTYKPTGKNDLKVYKVNKNKVEEVSVTGSENGYTFEIDGTAVNYVLYYNGGGSGGSGDRDKGCGGNMSAGISAIGVLVLAAATFMICRKKQRN